MNLVVSTLLRTEHRLPPRRFRAALAVLALALAACTPSASGSPSATGPSASEPAGSAEPEITMRVGHDSSEDHPYHLGWVAFKEEVETGTNGRIRVEIYPNAQLGDEGEMVNGLRAGSIDGVMIAMGTATTAVPEAQLFGVPFLFKDAQQAVDIAAGPMGEPIAAQIEEAFEAQILGWGQLGGGTLWNKVRPIQTVADMAGLKIRPQPQPIFVDAYNALGALPVTMSFDEVYTSLQTGVIDGGDNGPVDIVDARFYEVAQFLTFTNHFVIVNALLVSDRFLDEISAEDREIILEAGAIGAQAESDAADAANADAAASLVDLGLETIELDAAARLEFEAAMEPVYEEYASTVGGMDLIRQIQGQGD